MIRVSQGAQKCTQTTRQGQIAWERRYCVGGVAWKAEGEVSRTKKEESVRVAINMAEGDGRVNTAATEERHVH